MSDANERNQCDSDKARMWNDSDYAIIEMYGRGNHCSRLDLQTCIEEYWQKFRWPEGKSRVLDIGSGDGSVTTVLSKCLPSNCEIFGSDINEKIVQYANQKYGNERVKFIPFDVIGEVPEDMKGQFDHVFASYVFHWVREHEKAFTNIYNILPKGGEFFSMSLARCDVYSVCQILAKRDKWSRWMKKIDLFVSPHHEIRDPDIDMAKTLKKAGFTVLDCRCKQKFFVQTIEDCRGLLAGINCFDIPKHMWSEFVDDFIEVKRSNNLVDDDKGTIKMLYNLVVFHCIK